MATALDAQAIRELLRESNEGLKQSLTESITRSVTASIQETVAATVELKVGEAEQRLMAKFDELARRTTILEQAISAVPMETGQDGSETTASPNKKGRRAASSDSGSGFAASATSTWSPTWTTRHTTSGGRWTSHTGVEASQTQLPMGRADLVHVVGFPYEMFSEKMRKFICEQVTRRISIEPNEFEVMARGGDKSCRVRFNDSSKVALFLRAARADPIAYAFKDPITQKSEMTTLGVKPDRPPHIREAGKLLQYLYAAAIKHVPKGIKMQSHLGRKRLNIAARGGEFLVPIFEVNATEDGTITIKALVTEFHCLSADQIEAIVKEATAAMRAAGV